MCKHGKPFAFMMLAFCLWIGQHALYAQATGDEGIQIIASPKGTVVHIDGEYSVAGSTPYTVVQKLEGVYRIKAKRPGYEDYTAKFRFKPGVNHRISIRLTQKTRGRSFLRSMFVPGWGQSYTDQKTKSYFIRLSAVGALTYLIVRDVRYQNAVDDFEAVVRQYEANQKNSGKAEILLKDVQNAQGVVDNRFERRRTALLIAGSVYFYNILDALLFFPDFDVAGLRFSFDPNIQDSSIKLGFTARLSF